MGKTRQRSGTTPQSLNQRRHIADEAARIMSDEGLRDYQMAKRKAAGHLGLNDTSQWPGNDEIEQALNERLRLFGGANHDRAITLQWQIAIEVMTLFEPFSPRLTGALLRGSATPHAPIEIHLFADTTEDVTVYLFDNEIEYELCDKQYRMGPKHADQHTRMVGVRLEVDPAALEQGSNYSGGTVEVIAVIFPINSIRQAPKSPIDGHPMQRADLTTVRAMSNDV